MHISMGPILLGYLKTAHTSDPRMHQDLNAILDGLRDLELQGVSTLDCRSAQFAGDEQIGRLRMICQSWKVMFHAETLKLAGLFIAAAIGGKTIAAWLSRPVIGISRPQATLMLGLTIPQSLLLRADQVIE